MKKHPYLSLIALLVAIAPAMANAYSCKDITNQINEDINKYGDNLKNQKLDWMKLTWLQEQLGAETEKNSLGDATNFKWQCSNDAGYVIAVTDKNGYIEKVNGQFTSNSGSGMFAADVPNHEAQEKFHQLLEEMKLNPSPVAAIATPEENKEDLDCRNIIRKIHNNVEALVENPEALAQQHYPWQTLSWIKTSLGPNTNSSSGYDYIYIWNNFSLFQGMDGAIKTMGKTPQNVQEMDYATISNLMGRPKKTLFEKINLSTWQCPAENSSSLQVQSDRQGTLTTISGVDCVEQECSHFSTTLTGSELKRSFEKQVLAQAEADEQQFAVKLHDYNNYYKTNFSNRDELITDMTVKIKNYYANLRACTPGVYEYPIPILQNFLFNSAVIDKKKDNLCLVKTSYSIPEIGKIDLKCKYPVATLQMFNDNQATLAASGNITFSNDNPDELQKMINANCQRYINGVL